MKKTCSVSVLTLEDTSQKIHEKVISILKNHKQSTIVGLHQIIGGDFSLLKNTVLQMEKDGVLKNAKCTFDGTTWQVYKLKKK